MPSKAKQRVIIALATTVAFAAMAVAILYSGDTDPSAPVLSGTAADGGGDRAATDGEIELVIDPIEGWFPAAGEGSGCSEPVGVDLIPGYSAILTINGTTIADEDTNVYTDINSRTLSAGGSQGQVTWGPEEDCPFGELLRATNNQVSACVYRTLDGPESCRVIARPDTFDF